MSGTASWQRATSEADMFRRVVLVCFFGHSRCKGGRAMNDCVLPLSLSLECVSFSAPSACNAAPHGIVSVVVVRKDALSPTH